MIAAPPPLAAKQAEFEESIRLKNQFRTLDEDEVGFLDSVLESERAKEAAAKRETEEQLEAFRRQREAAQKVNLDASAQDQTSTIDLNDGIAWVTKKRRKKELDSGASKLRKTSTSAENKPAGLPPHGPAASSKPTGSHHAKSQDTVQPSSVKEPTASLREAAEAPALAPSRASALGLSAYSSDED
jgi:FAM192A/Fyv6, N-terminal domain